MNITSVECPRCHSKNLYKFGFDKQANQKYQCKECKRQFIIGSTASPRKNYPKCPRCGAGMYLHHRHKHYCRFKCNNRKCNHTIVKYHSFNIEPASSEAVAGNVSLKGMRFPFHVVITALTLYFLNNSSTRSISDFFMATSNLKVSHVTIASWATKFAPLFKKKSDELIKDLNLKSDDWHADETVVFIKGKKYYLWLAIDSETRFVLAFHLSPYRDENSAHILINEASKHGFPSSLITDRWPAYSQAAATLLPNTVHIPVEPMSGDMNNNLIESFNKTFKAWYKTKKGFNSFEKANCLIFVFIYYYNFLRPHGSLNKLSPAEVAGLDTSSLSKYSWFLAS